MKRLSPNHPRNLSFGLLGVLAALGIAALVLFATGPERLDSPPSGWPWLGRRSPTTAFAMPDYADTVLGDGPVAYWRLGESEGGSFANSAGGDDAQVTGGVNLGVPGPLQQGSGGAAQFDGTSGSAVAQLDLSSYNSITVEFWLAWDSFANDDRLALEYSGTDRTFQEVDGFLIDPNSGYWPGNFEVSLGDGSGTTYDAALFRRPSAGTWHYYAFVLDRTAPPGQQIVPYVDGVPVSYTNPAANSRRPAPGHERFSGSALFFMSRLGTQLFGAGSLAEVAIYPTTLSPDQIARHYSVGSGQAPQPVAAPAPQVQVPPAQVGATGNRTFTPPALPLAGPELADPGRGEYRWFDNPVNPPGWPWLDAYARYSWRDLEPSPGQYDFSQIDAQLAAAAARGGRFGFRVISACTGCGGANVSVPDYVKQGAGGFSTGDGSWIPNWNNSVYLSRFEALLRALGDRYRHDPRLGFIDMMGYGNWGEWHDSPYSDQQLLTDASARQLIDANLSDFPGTPIVMLTADTGALRYALSRSPRVGIRVDCLGNKGLSGAEETFAQVPEALDRWKTAPFVTEWCGEGHGDEFQVGLNQVRQYHVSLLSSGNFAGAWGSLSQPEADAFAQANKSSGYRYVLDSLTLPATVASGASFSASSTWENVNVAPTYHAWAVLLQFRDGAGNLAWEGQSSLDLRKVLPTGGTLVVQQDTFALPANLPGGVYMVSVQIRDPDQISPPLQLATQGRQSDGSYALGTITVQ